jgi:hypothetical protein
MAGPSAGRCLNESVALVGGWMESVARREYVHVRVCAIALPRFGSQHSILSLECVDGLSHRVSDTGTTNEFLKPKRWCTTYCQPAVWS